MYSFKQMILGLCVVSCMVHGAAAEKKVAHEGTSQYEVEVVPVKQRRLPCGLARLGGRCWRKPAAVIINTTHKTIPIRYYGLDILIPYQGRMGYIGSAARKVDHTDNLIGNGKFVVTPRPDYTHALEDFENDITKELLIPQSQLKKTFEWMHIPKCPDGCTNHCTNTAGYLYLGRNPKKFSLFPEDEPYPNSQYSGTTDYRQKNPIYDLKPGCIYRIVEKAKKSEKLKGS